MFEEATRIFIRAQRLKDKLDHSGAAEASQHSTELAIKSLFKMVELDPPRDHDPGKYFDKVLKQFKKLRDEDEDIIDGSIFTRLRFLSSLLQRLHSEGMYGFKGTPASKVFTDRDSARAQHKTVP